MDFTPMVYVTVIAALLLVVIGLLIWVIVLLVRGRRNIQVKTASESPSQVTTSTSTAAPKLSVTARVMTGMALVSVAFVGIIVAVGRTQTLALPLLLIAGVVIFLNALAALVVIFVRNGLSNRNYALGLPDGSIRAIIALSLILLFAIMAVFLYIGQGGFGTTIQPTAAQTDIAKQLVTTLSTLVVAIASFYFGSTTVREAKKPEGEIPEGPTPPPPPPT
jgi:hypothetical protein